MRDAAWGAFRRRVALGAAFFALRFRNAPKGEHDARRVVPASDPGSRRYPMTQTPRPGDQTRGLRGARGWAGERAAKLNGRPVMFRLVGVRVPRFLIDNPQDAIRVRANYYAASSDKGRPTPVRSGKDRHSFGTSWPGMTIPEEPARGPGSGGR
jgi:hypothetical protein